MKKEKEEERWRGYIIYDCIFAVFTVANAQIGGIVRGLSITQFEYGRCVCISYQL